MPSTIAIVGRPNVGKSTLFNRLIGQRKAIVGDLPGITRDRLTGQGEWGGKSFTVIDTGGLHPGDESEIPAQIFRQARAAISRASTVLLVVDTKAGLTPADEELARHLREFEKKIVVVANKADTVGRAAESAEFYSLGFESVFPVSAESGAGIGDLLDFLLERSPVGSALAGSGLAGRVAIIGRPNVGKSSLVNCILGEERVIVSPIPGTTRDSVDERFRFHGSEFEIIDTAGIRRKGKTSGLAEKMSVVMARKHIERADIAVLVLDAQEGPSHLDATIAGIAHEAGRSMIIAVNKWDLMPKGAEPMREFETKVREMMKYLDYAPLVFLSAATGQRIPKLLQHVSRAAEARRLRVGTGELNRFFERFVIGATDRAPKDRAMKIQYLTQVSSAPPTFLLFAGYSKRPMHFSTERYIVNKLRSEFGFFAAPIRLIVRRKEKRN